VRWHWDTVWAARTRGGVSEARSERRQGAGAWGGVEARDRRRDGRDGYNQIQ
jgi:hypothetical protein